MMIIRTKKKESSDDEEDEQDQRLTLGGLGYIFFLGVQLYFH